jgi:hypothetical protein
MAANGMTVRMLQSALGRAETNTNTIPKPLRNIDVQGAWRSFVFPEDTDTVYRWTAAEFRNQHTEKEDRCDNVTPILPDTIPFPSDGKASPTGNNQHTKGNSDNVTDSSGGPETIPFPSAASPAPQGNSTSYALRRLQREARGDLLDRVRAGEGASRKKSTVTM